VAPGCGVVIDGLSKASVGEGCFKQITRNSNQCRALMEGLLS
jgi:hypothetical protein